LLPQRVAHLHPKGVEQSQEPSNCKALSCQLVL